MPSPRRLEQSAGCEFGLTRCAPVAYGTSDTIGPQLQYQTTRMQSEMGVLRGDIEAIKALLHQLVSGQTEVQKSLTSLLETPLVFSSSMNGAKVAANEDNPVQEFKKGEIEAEPKVSTAESNGVVATVESKENVTRFSEEALMQAEIKQCLMLKEIFEESERAEEEAALLKAEGRFAAFKKDSDTALDAVIGVVICINAAYLGVMMDQSEAHPTPFFICDMVFCIIFTLEILFKISTKGAVQLFCGPGKWFNLFDLAIVLVDLVQITLAIASPDSAEGVGNFSGLLRIFKLAKLTRLVRLLKSAVFQDLVAMIRGLLGGITTLGWAIVLFLLIVYVAALLFREFFGRKEYENVYEYFENVPRSVYTTFRCSLGDCSAQGGVPIPEHVQLHYGALHSFGYALYSFFVTIGLFNVVSAIFVEATMQAGMNIELNKKKARLADQTLWATRIANITRGLISASDDHDHHEKMSDKVEEINKYEFPSQCLDKAVLLPYVKKSLEQLDIDPEDNAHLSDILDPDNGGTIAVRDLIEGLRRLRGEPKRSDIVAVDLMIRSIQHQLGGLIEMVASSQKTSVISSN